MQSGLACYSVPVKDFERQNGVSYDKDLTVNYFGRKMSREDILIKNKENFVTKWHDVITSDKLESLKFYRFECFLEKVKKEAYPEKESDIHSIITRKTLDKLLNKNLLAEDSKVLDVGCGQN